MSVAVAKIMKSLFKHEKEEFIVTETRRSGKLDALMCKEHKMECVCESSPVHKLAALRRDNQNGWTENVDLEVFFISSLCFLIIQHFCPDTFVVTSLHCRVHAAHTTFI